MRFTTTVCILSAMALIILALAGCASRYYLMVDYKLPPASEQLQGRALNLEVKDAREDTRVFTPAAARRFGAFRDNYQLTFVSGKDRTSVGPRDLQGLFQDAFEKRLATEGARISQQPDAPLILVTITSAQMDTQERKWIARISYTAELRIDNRMVTRETVAGNAERIRLVGTDNVDETMSDMVTEIINRLDIAKMLRQASE
jgi:uncharacterized lipoprotein YajG